MRAALDRALTRAPEWLWLLIRLWGVVRSPAFVAAQQAVRKVAADPSFRDKRGPLAYAHMQAEAAVYHPLGENVIREVEARMWTQVYAADAGTRVSWPVAGVLTELAYLALKERGR